MPNQFRFILKTQFTFCVSDEQLSCILNKIANQGININGYEQSVCQTKCNQINMIRLVPGTTDVQGNNDVITVISILRKLDVMFRQKKVIQILDLPPGVPGQINAIFGVLWCKVNVFSIYLGEDNTLYLDVSNNEKAIRILSSNQVIQCPKSC